MIKDSAGNHAQGVIINIRNEGLFPYLQRVGERDWVLYHRHRWLRPFAWLREGLVFFQKYVELLRKGKNVLSKRSQSSDRYEMLKKLGLILLPVLVQMASPHGKQKMASP